MRRDSAVMLILGEPLLFLVAFEEGYAAEVGAVLQWKGCVCLSIIRQKEEGSVIDGYIWSKPRE